MDFFFSILLCFQRWFFYFDFLNNFRSNISCLLRFSNIIFFLNLMHSFNFHNFSWDSLHLYFLLFFSLNIRLKCLFLTIMIDYFTWSFSLLFLFIFFFWHFLYTETLIDLFTSRLIVEIISDWSWSEMWLVLAINWWQFARSPIYLWHSISMIR
jgi:hypothetical protein